MVKTALPPKTGVAKTRTQADGVATTTMTTTAMGRIRNLINSKWGQRILLPLGFLALSYFIYDQFFSEPSLEAAVAKGKAAPYPVLAENAPPGGTVLGQRARRTTGPPPRKYAEQYVEINGKVRKVNADKAIIVLESPNATHGISCSFPSKEDVSGVKPGDQVDDPGRGRRSGKAGR